MNFTAASGRDARLRARRRRGAAVPPAFDAVFSNATFHWIPDHDRLFRSIHDGPQSGRAAGRAVRRRRQPAPSCYGRARASMADRASRRSSTTGQDPWRFADVDVDPGAGSSGGVRRHRRVTHGSAHAVRRAGPFCRVHRRRVSSPRARAPARGHARSVRRAADVTRGRRRSAVDARLLAPEHLGAGSACRDSAVRNTDGRACGAPGRRAAAVGPHLARRGWPPSCWRSRF